MTKHKKLTAILLSALIGAAGFLIVNTSLPLSVTDDSYIMRGYVERDIIQHYTGWLLYRESHISFPFGVSRLIGYPSGGAVAFADSLPAVSVILGWFDDLLPGTFQFFGIYTLLSFILTGIASALLMSLFFNRILPVTLSSLLFIFSPVMLERVFRHTALSSHYLIIFALYLYFLNRKEGFRYRSGYPILCFIAVSLHFYFVPMILAILLADLLQQYSETKKCTPILLFLSLNILSVIFTACLFGYFFTNTLPSGVLGYGYFTMNLNAPVNPVSLSGIRWSYILPSLGQGLGSTEGFNYLGLGVLLAIVGSCLFYIITGRINLLIFKIRSHLPLAVITVILTVFAVSTTVVINNNAYLKIDLPLKLLHLFSVFRSSGRMFWPVYYLLVLFAVLQWKNIPNSKLCTVGIFLLVVIQLADLIPAIKTKRDFFTHPAEGFSNPMDNAFFTENTESYDTLFTFSDAGMDFGLYIANYAARNGVKTNEPFMARNDLVSYRKGNTEEYMKLMNRDIDGQTLYIFDDTNRFFNAALLLGDEVESFRLSTDDFSCYIIAPKNATLTLPATPDITSLRDIPLTLADYSDLSWTCGILNEHTDLLLFYDNAFTQAFLEDASFLVCGGRRIEIVNRDYSDAGWVMVTVASSDTAFLIGEPLTTE